MALLSFDIGGISVKYGLYKGNRLQLTNSFHTPKSWDEMKAHLYKVLLSFQEEKLEGVAISSPGAVDSNEGIVHGISAVPYIHNFKIVDELKELFDLPVTIENDANCAALAELTYGVAKNYGTVLFFIIGSGIGGSVALDGKLHKGRNLFGGEFGYMVLDDGYTLSHLASPVQVANRFSSDNEAFTITGQELFQRSDEGEEKAQEAIDGLIKALGRGIFNASLVLNPDLVVLGGGMSKRDGIVDRVKEHLDELREQTGALDLEIDMKVCHYFNDANLLGAVVHFQNRKDLKK